MHSEDEIPPSLLVRGPSQGIVNVLGDVLYEVKGRAQISAGRLKEGASPGIPQGGLQIKIGRKNSLVIKYKYTL